MKKNFKEGMKVEVVSRKGNILNRYGFTEKGNPIGVIKKVFKYTESKFKYKVRIAPNCCIYCTAKDIREVKVEV